MAERTSLLIRCSKEEAELIRRAARAERRTISGFVLHATMTRIAYVRTRVGTQGRGPNPEDRQPEER